MPIEAYEETVEVDGRKVRFRIWRDGRMYKLSLLPNAQARGGFEFIGARAPQQQGWEERWKGVIAALEAARVRGFELLGRLQRHGRLDVEDEDNGD